MDEDTALAAEVHAAIAAAIKLGLLHAELTADGPRYTVTPAGMAYYLQHRPAGRPS